MLYDPNWKPAETEIKLEKWQEILLEAATLLETKGWTKAVLHDEKNDSFCTLGAIQQVCFSRVVSNDADMKFQPAYRRRKIFKDYQKAVTMMAANVRASKIWSWNDNQENADTVIKTIKRVALKG